MLIFIPSRGRAHLIGKTSFCPWKQMSEYNRLSVFYVVPRSEYEQYRKALPKSIWVIQSSAENIAEKRYEIGKISVTLSTEKFMMVDDDVKWFRRRSASETNLIPADEEDISSMLKTVEMRLDTFAHVGVSAREGNNRLGIGGVDLVRRNTRTNRALAYRTEDFMSVEHMRVPVMEDFDVNLQLLKKGLPNCNLAYFSQDQPGTQREGGCSGYRTHEMHEQAAKKLAELHPGLVSLREKNNKTGGEFGKRTEVTIQWKKAYEQGERNAGNNT